MLLALILASQAPDIAPSGGDDADRLQRLIGATARESSGRTVTLAPGVYLLSKGLYVPAGTRGFAFRGAGMRRTALKDASGKGINRLLQIGWDIQANSNYNILPKSSGGAGKVLNTLVAGIAEGQKTLKIIGAPAEPSYTRKVMPGRWYLLYDDDESLSYQGTSSIRNHAEPVFVASVEGDILTLREPVGRTYDGRAMPRLAHLDSQLSRDVSVAGLTIDAGNKPESYNVMPVSWTAGFKAQDIEIKGFMQNAIIVQDSINWEVGGAEIYTASGGQTGSGYGIVGGRGSRFGKVHDVKSRLIQGNGYSIVMAHGGGSDMEVWNVEAPGGKLDIHGMDSQRITFRDSSVADLHIGNNQWLAAGKGHRAENIKLTSSVWVQAGARDVVLRKVFATGVVLNSQYGDRGGKPPNGYPEDVTFIDCQFKDSGKTGLILGEEGGNVYRGKVGRVTFKNCSFSNRNSKYGGILVWRDKFEGDMIFQGCTFRTDTAPFFEAMFRVKNTASMGRASLTIEDSTFIAGDPATDYAIGIGEWAGALTIRNNELVTPRQGASLVQPGPSLRGVLSGNRVRRP